MILAKVCSMRMAAVSIGLACLVSSCQTYQMFLSSSQAVGDAKNEVVRSKNKKSFFGIRKDCPICEAHNSLPNFHQNPVSHVDESEFAEADAAPPALPNESPEVALITDLTNDDLPPVMPVEIPKPTPELAVSKTIPAPKSLPRLTPVAKAPPAPKPAMVEQSPNLKDDIQVALSVVPDDDTPHPNQSVESVVKKVDDLLKLKPRQPAPAKQPIKVDADGVVRIINADGEDIFVTGKNGVVIIKGSCGMLTLSGSKNRVTCDRAEKVAITGSENTVVTKIISAGYISGSRNELSWIDSADGKVPNLVSTGTYNNINRIK